VSEDFGHQPLFAFNEDCFGGFISTCFRATGAETFYDVSIFNNSCPIAKNPEALILYAIAEF